VPTTAPSGSETSRTFGGALLTWLVSGSRASSAA
jgi:hypothetical protein